MSNSSARSRKIKAAAKASKLEAQMKFLDKEAELRRLTCVKELQMARAQRDAMKSLKEEEQERANKLEQAVTYCFHDVYFVSSCVILHEVL